MNLQLILPNYYRTLIRLSDYLHLVSPLWLLNIGTNFQVSNSSFRYLFMLLNVSYLNYNIICTIYNIISLYIYLSVKTWYSSFLTYKDSLTENKLVQSVQDSLKVNFARSIRYQQTNIIEQVPTYLALRAALFIKSNTSWHCCIVCSRRRFLLMKLDARLQQLWFPCDPSLRWHIF